ncbi:BTB/POZ domain-containing protein KCTD21-like [Dysidea avara]|uniref:BTB/POZ domain-containing protein KCTD21-like n=1 Tax=Dysidea avara TaxID=196820 RepID=UPI00332BE860
MSSSENTTATDMFEQVSTATEMFKQVFEQVSKDKQQVDQEKKKWEEEKAKVNNTFLFHGPIIDLNVGGTRYSTSRSTLTKYPESMLGVMFSGRHDLEAMKCSDGSFFIDRDGTHFRLILNYLRDGEEVVRWYPKSFEALQEIFCEAKYYQLEGLINALKPLVREVDVVSQNDILLNFTSGDGSYNTDYSGGSFDVSYDSMQAISYKVKSMKKLYFSNLKFVYPVSFISCDLTNASFSYCCFESDVVFEDCILDNTTFSIINGLVTNSHNVSFSGSKTDKTNFDSNLRTALKSAGKIF